MKAFLLPLLCCLIFALGCKTQKREATPPNGFKPETLVSVQTPTTTVVNTFESDSSLFSITFYNDSLTVKSGLGKEIPLQNVIDLNQYLAAARNSNLRYLITANPNTSISLINDVIDILHNHTVNNIRIVTTPAK